MRPRRSPSKSVQKSDSKEKIANAIDQLDLLHTPFIDHGDYGGIIPRALDKDDLLVVWRGWKTHRSCRGLVRMWR
jgi:hypothetical protein